MMTDYLDNNLFETDYIRSYKHCITIELIKAMELVLLKVTTAKSA